MLKELEDTLRGLTEEDKVVLKDLLTNSLGEGEEEKEPLIELAENTEGFAGDGVMTIQAHKAYKDATGEFLTRDIPKKQEEIKRWGGEDSTLVREWKERNKSRQDEDFKRLLKRRG